MMKHSPRIQAIFFLLFLAVVFSGCATTTRILTEHYSSPQVLGTKTLCPVTIQWQPVEPGIETTGHVIKSENIKWKCIRIDLETPGLSVYATPHKNELGKKFTHKNFARKNNLIAAVNTTPFDLDGGTNIPVSIIKIDGEVICPENPGYSALTISRTSDSKYRASIIRNQKTELIQSSDFAFGGFYTILENGKIYQFEKYKRSRTAAGISDNGRYLYLFAACGIACPNGRNGLNFEECALILQELGCTDALEFDGGHSTGLVLNGKDFLHPALQRKVPALLGFALN